MKFGVLFRVQDPPNGAHIGRRMHETIQTSRVAEQAGFDGVFLPEHHMMDDGYLPNPFPLLGALAAATERVEIGTTIHLLPLHNPMISAEAAAVVDQMAGGRLRLGVGACNFAPEFELMGLKKKGQADRFDEAIELLQKAWTGEEFEHHGRFYDVKGKLRPTPVNAQLWIGAMSEAGVQRAARYGCPWPTDPLHNLAVLKHWTEIYRQTAVQHGTEQQTSVVLLRDGWIADSLEEVEKTWWPVVRADHWMYFQKVPRFITELEPTLTDVEREEDFVFERHRIDRFIVGPADECIAAIRRMQEELAMDYLIITFRFAYGPEHEHHLDCIRRFGAEVIPAFR